MNEERNIWVRREQFLEDPRSEEIRGVCVEILRRLYSLHTENTADDAQVRANIESTLEHLNGSLIELGITPGMKANRPTTDYKIPQVMAEFVAGQLIPFTGKSIRSEKAALPTLKEFGERTSDEEGGSTFTADMKELSKLPSKKDFFALRRAIDMGSYFLDAEEEMKMPPQEANDR